jgi:hypothetical protein
MTNRKKIRNRKFEIRNKFKVGMLQGVQKPLAESVFPHLLFLSFRLVSNFEFRISNLAIFRHLSFRRLTLFMLEPLNHG